jgi:hypothetical protein
VYGSSTAAARALIDAAVPLARLDPAAASSMLSTVAGLVSLAGDRDLAGEAIAALDTLPSPADPAVVVTVTVARAMARQIADDPEGALRLLNEIDDAEWAEMGAKGPLVRGCSRRRRQPCAATTPRHTRSPPLRWPRRRSPDSGVGLLTPGNPGPWRSPSDAGR